MSRVLIPFEANLRVGGIQSAIIELIESNEINNENEFVFLLPNKGDLGDFLRAKGLKVYYWGNDYYWEMNFKKPFKLIKDIIGISRKINKIIEKEKINVIYTNMTTTLLSSVLVKRKINNKIKIINHIRVANLSKKNIMVLNMIKNKVDIYATLTNFMSENLIESGISPKKVIKLTDSTNFCNINQCTIEKYENKVVKVALIGRISEIKGHKQYIEIINNIISQKDKISKDLVFFIVGKAVSLDDKIYLKEVEDLISEYNLSNIIKFTGEIENINDFLKDIDILFCTTQYPGEGFGKVIIEAQANYIPVIAFNYGAVNEIINNNIDGYIVDTLDDFVSKSNELIKNSNKRHKMGERAYQNVYENFNCITNNKNINKLFSFLGEDK